MSKPAIAFSDVLIKQLVQDWGDAHNQDAGESIIIHFEQRRFGVRDIRVESARVEGELLLFQIVTDQWSVPREFALTPDGSMMW